MTDSFSKRAFDLLEEAGEFVFGLFKEFTDGLGIELPEDEKPTSEAQPKTKLTPKQFETNFRMLRHHASASQIILKQLEAQAESQEEVEWIADLLAYAEDTFDYADAKLNPDLSEDDS